MILAALSNSSLLAAYAVPLAAIWASAIGIRRLRERRAEATWQEMKEAGLTQPASLHPVINPEMCIGCGTCVNACPEGKILGLVNGKAKLVEPANCIGHGACAAACPLGAIDLVFGTAERGVDIPHVGPDFQTNVPGLYIAGELGGMGLIRNAIEQGRQAMEEIARRKDRPKGVDYDVIIVGAGPAGISASLAAMEKGLRHLTLEQESFGGTVAHFPRGKIVMTAPVLLPLYGTAKFRETTKEELLAFWEKVAADTGLEVSYGERVDAIERTDKGFLVRTPNGEYTAGAVLLAIGRRGTPRKLGVPGEDQSKVVYRLVDPEQYRGQHVLVVGGGDSALEAAVSISEVPDTTVTLSYRGEGFSRAKPKNRKKVEAAQAEGRLEVLLGSNVKRIGERDVEIKIGEREITIPNDAVIVCAGGILPTGFLKSIGIEVETKYGTA
ncbi:MAG: 4Fe-4S dicluster domain-containing protein [Alphaproteobacteria bacterium]|nr:MAG: 4Fe-4S dicluster domain-containing protein [Alphaproteobacteria bacterium]